MFTSSVTGTYGKGTYSGTHPKKLQCCQIERGGCLVQTLDHLFGSNPHCNLVFVNCQSFFFDAISFFNLFCSNKCILVLLSSHLITILRIILVQTGKRAPPPLPPPPPREMPLEKRWGGGGRGRGYWSIGYRDSAQIYLKIII